VYARGDRDFSHEGANEATAFPGAAFRLIKPWAVKDSNLQP
jgi:hypothetical protein